MSIYNLRHEEDLNAAIESEIICNDKYCPYYIKHSSSPSHHTCEGEFCEEAFSRYCNSNNEYTSQEYESDEEILGNLPNEIRKSKENVRKVKDPKEYEWELLEMTLNNILENFDKDIEVKVYKEQKRVVRRVPRAWWGWTLKLWNYLKVKFKSLSTITKKGI